MNGDALVVILWLACAHLVADFVLQTGGMATRKFAAGRGAWAALAGHAAVVGIVLSPVVLVYGARGATFLAVTVVSHLAIDRLKIVATRRSERRSAERSPGADAGSGPPLDRSWTPVPGALFVVDQLAHIVVLLVAWLVLLAPVAPAPALVEVVDRVLGPTDRAALHRITVTTLVLVALVIVNVRAASLFVGVLVRAPRRHRSADATPSDAAPPVAGDGDDSPPTAALGYTLRAGPLVARLEPDERPAGPPRPASRQPATVPSSDVPRPARVGEAIGVLERLLIVGLVLGGAVETIGLVVAAKTLARFKQLDDREFAEYYLLGTLASVGVAVLSALLARAILAAP
jgi:hypothetical protein